MSETRLIEPSDIAGVSGALAADPSATLLGGGQLVVAGLNAGDRSGGCVVSLSRVSAMRGIVIEDGGTCRIGAMTTHRDIVMDTRLSGAFRLLRLAAATIAHPAIRARATLGGTIAAKEASSDMLPALLALEARVIVADGDGERAIDIGTYLDAEAGAGTGLPHVITAVEMLSGDGDWRVHYEKLSRVDAEYALAGVAVALRQERGMVKEARLAVGGCAQRPRRLSIVETAIVGCSDCDAVVSGLLEKDDMEWVDRSDAKADATYRRRVLPGLVRRAVSRAREDRDDPLAFGIG